MADALVIMGQGILAFDSRGLRRRTSTPRSGHL